MDKKLMSKKKPAYPITKQLSNYLTEHSRNIKIPIYYEDLLRFQGAVEIYDKNGNDTLWVSTYFAEHERDEIELSLKQMYTILHADGSDEALQYITIDAIDFCTFGNTKPFRIKVRNILNDNYVYLYIKKADASRIYGLELEHLLSPNHINFLVHGDTIIEEHISGIPGDTFINENLDNCSNQDKKAIAKEFVKFNERCFIRLLGDMRSYNYVFVLTHDFDRIDYRIRAIDFDQQSFEGNLKVYNLQFLKENFKIVDMVNRKLDNNSITQYKLEERSFMAKRMITSPRRATRLIKCMKNDTISFPNNVQLLKKHLIKYVGDVKFKECNNMGEILETILVFVKRNYQDVLTK